MYFHKGTSKGRQTPHNSSPNLSLYPSNHQVHHKADFIIRRQCPPLFYLMPFFKTSTATCGGCMLRYENRMSPHRSLFSVIFRIRRCQTGCDEIRSLGSDGVDALVTDVWRSLSVNLNRDLNFESLSAASAALTFLVMGF